MSALRRCCDLIGRLGRGVPLALAGILLGACATSMEKPDEAPETCRVQVEENFGEPEFRPHPFSGSDGTFVGIVSVAGEAAMGPPSPATLVAVPLGAIAGGIVGTVCAVYSARMPNANADFREILRTADSGLVKREIEARLNRERPACAVARSNDAVNPSGDTVLTIEKITVMMGCPYGKQEFSVAVHWRAVLGSRTIESPKWNRARAGATGWGNSKPPSVNAESTACDARASRPSPT